MKNLKRYDGKRNGVYIVFLDKDDNKKALDMVKVYSDNFMNIWHTANKIHTRKWVGKADSIIHFLTCDFKEIDNSDILNFYVSNSSKDYSDIIKKSNIDINAVEVIKTE